MSLDDSTAPESAATSASPEKRSGLAGKVPLLVGLALLLVVGLIGFVITGFNKLRTTDIGAQEALGGIDVQLTRRADLIHDGRHITSNLPFDRLDLARSQSVGLPRGREGWV